MKASHADEFGLSTTTSEPSPPITILKPSHSNPYRREDFRKEVPSRYSAYAPPPRYEPNGGIRKRGGGFLPPRSGFPSGPPVYLPQYPQNMQYPMHSYPNYPPPPITWTGYANTRNMGYPQSNRSKTTTRTNLPPRVTTTNPISVPVPTKNVVRNVENVEEANDKNIEEIEREITKIKSRRTTKKSEEEQEQEHEIVSDLLTQMDLILAETKTLKSTVNTKNQELNKLQNENLRLVTENKELITKNINLEIISDSFRSRLEAKDRRIEELKRPSFFEGLNKGGLGDIEDEKVLKKMSEENSELMGEYRKEYNRALEKIVGRIKELKLNICNLCYDKQKEMVYNCGHLVCGECNKKIEQECPFCRVKIRHRFKIFKN